MPVRDRLLCCVSLWLAARVLHAGRPVSHAGRPAARTPLRRWLLGTAASRVPTLTEQELVRR